MEQAHLIFLEDEQYAKDLQVAYDLHAREERRAQRRLERKNNHGPAELGDGFTQGAVNADHMLFVSCTMDSHLVSMLVDTGASTSAMSREMVTLLGLEGKMNSSFHGNAQGVGSSPIVGIVEHVTCRIGDVGFRSFFLVLEGSMPYCILGLDQMRRFNCVVDVGGNSLIFGGRDGVSVPFLPQADAAGVAYAMMTSNDTAPAQAVQEEQSQNTQPLKHVRTKSGGFGTYTSWGRRNQGGR